MIEIDGIVTRSGPMAERGNYMMGFKVVLAPWRQRGVGGVVDSELHLEIAMDMDMADSWLQHLRPDACVLVTCDSLELVPDPHDGKLRVHGTAIHDQDITDELYRHLGLGN